MADQAVVKERVLVVDDDEQTRASLGRILADGGYRCTSASTPAQARERLAEAPFDLMLCDVQPGGSACLDLLEHALVHHSHTTAVIASGRDDVALADRALEIGACGYLVKPFDANDVLRSVTGAGSRRRDDVDAARELRVSREETAQRLCAVVEARDPDTAAHVAKMGDRCGDVAHELGLPADHCELIRAASAMHDVGKIGMPDDILLKPGKLTADERVTMEQHAEIGHRILLGSRSALLQLAAMIAWTHHEKFDGSGYPRGLAGHDIPLEGRIAAVADFYDALTRDRVYRPRFSHSDALELLERGRGTHFDPYVLDALLVTLERASPLGQSDYHRT